MNSGSRQQNALAVFSFQDGALHQAYACYKTITNVAGIARQDEYPLRVDCCDFCAGLLVTCKEKLNQLEG